MIYQSLKLSNGIWGLVEIKLSPGNPSITLSFKSRVMEIAQSVFQVSFILFSFLLPLLLLLLLRSNPCYSYS
jgi:hypothetical protein